MRLNVIAVLLAAVLLLSGYGVSRKASRAFEAGSRRGRLSASKIGTMSRADVEKLLDRIECVPEPESVIGAMCYEPVALPSVVEYLCPLCGTKTVYSDYTESGLVLSIQETRMLFDTLSSLTRLEMVLDETSFCSECRDSETEPGFVLRVTWEDGSEHAARVTPDDLRMLLGLFSGGTSYRTSNEGSVPLKPFSGRLRDILGLED